MFARLGLAVIASLMVFGHTPETKAEGHVSSAGILVKLNNAKVLKLSRSAATVIVGNPEIADASVKDSNTLILTGRGFGRTNLIILDEAGDPILDEQIAVSRDTREIVRVYRQSEIENLSCEPECEAAYLTEAELQAVTATNIANNAGEDGGD